MGVVVSSAVRQKLDPMPIMTGRRGGGGGLPSCSARRPFPRGQLIIVRDAFGDAQNRPPPPPPSSSCSRWGPPRWRCRQRGEASSVVRTSRGRSPASASWTFSPAPPSSVPRGYQVHGDVSGGRARRARGRVGCVGAVGRPAGGSRGTRDCHLSAGDFSPIVVASFLSAAGQMGPAKAATAEWDTN